MLKDNNNFVSAMTKASKKGVTVKQDVAKIMEMEEDLPKQINSSRKSNGFKNNKVAKMVDDSSPIVKNDNSQANDRTARDPKHSAEQPQQSVKPTDQPKKKKKEPAEPKNTANLDM